MKALDPGQKLRDVNYGPGVVLTSDVEYTTIRFRGFGIKKFITSMIQMELIEKPKPQKPDPTESKKGKASGKLQKAMKAKPAPAKKAKASAKKKKPAGKSKHRAAKKKPTRKSKRRR